MIALEHEGYIGVIDTLDAEAGLMSGTVMGIRDVIHFEGASVEEVRSSFVRSVDAYVRYCRAEGVEPQKAKSGRFNLRLAPDLHRRIEAAASASGDSLNSWIERHLERAVEREFERVAV